MPGTLTTNDPRGLGYQTGLFSAPPGAPVNQDFFNLAFAGRINNNKIYKEAYNCNIIGTCTMSSWLEEFMGTETDCHPDYTLLERSGWRQQIRAAAATTIPTRATTGTITLSAKDQFVNSNYILPIVGNTIVLAPSGQLAEVESITHTLNTADAVITVRQRSATAPAQVIPIGSEMMVLSGAIIQDCACPTGQFAFEDLPTEYDKSMITFGDKGSLCGDALNKCQYLKIPFYDQNGKEVSGAWYTEEQRLMYQRFEMRKHTETLLNPNFGIVPTLRARGLKFTPAISTAITTDDIRDWKALLDINGTQCREYAVFAGRNLYSQFQRMLLSAGVVKLDMVEQPLADCKWINMEYCGIKVEGITLHIYDECSFSSGKQLGAVWMNFPDSAIFVTMCDNNDSINRSTVDGRDGYTGKLFARVYFRSNDGRVWDSLYDSNGVLPGSKRNTFGTGCETQEWSVKTRFVNDLYCVSSWGYIGLN